MYFQILLFSAPPSVNPTIQILSGDVFEHRDVIVRCSLSATQGETIKYNWTDNQGTLLARNALSGDLTLEGIKRTEAGPYTCTAGNVAGSTQKSVTLNVLCR